MWERIGFESVAVRAALEAAEEAAEMTDILVALSVKVLILLGRTNKAIDNPIQFYFGN
jgi:hypothetical protein